MFGREEDGTRLHRVQVRDHRADRVGIGERRRAPHQSRQSGGDVGLRRREDLTGDPRLAGAGRVVNAHHRARGNRRLRRRAPIHTETADTVGDGAHRRRRIAVAGEPRQCPLDQRPTPPGSFRETSDSSARARWSACATDASGRTSSRHGSRSSCAAASSPSASTSRSAHRAGSSCGTSSSTTS